ncbi:hypothetical protein HDV05_008339 [Chytridiales sp. JEL 0842]|nr:hypothetical protein HDV05_008339 [Chytridiales sp. JEL 0842]
MNSILLRCSNAHTSTINHLSNTTFIPSTSSLILNQHRHASKKSGGSSSNGRTSNPHHLGPKTYQNTRVQPSTILVRQRGFKYHPGPNVHVGKDFTLHASCEGVVGYGYDLAAQRKVVYVTPASGTLASSTMSASNDVVVGIEGIVGSKTQTKQMLSDRVDAEKYLKLDGLGRYKYVLDLAKEIVDENKQKQIQALEKKLVTPRRRGFGLVDLSLV